MIISASATRVPEQTDDRVNEKIHHMTKISIDYHARHPEEIDQRLKQLDEEWDVERTLQTNAAALTLTGVALGVLAGRRWLMLPAIVGGFLLQHGIQGWCPPVPFLRRMGVRTAREIEAERYALKVLRGDFKDIPSNAEGVESALRATGRLD